MVWSVSPVRHSGSHWRIVSQGRSSKGGEWCITFSKHPLSHKTNVTNLERVRDEVGTCTGRLWKQPRESREVWAWGTGTVICQMCVLGGWERESLLFGSSPQTWARVFTFYPGMESADPNWSSRGTLELRILPFCTWSCFSLNYNCFLHNEKPAREWQSIKNYFSPPLRL